MKTWTNYAAGTGAATTEWKYDAYRGFLTNKFYADAKGTSYGYTNSGRLLSRIWARGVATAYDYTEGGDLKTIIYSDGTAGVTNIYDRLGRPKQINQGTNLTLLVHDLPGRLLSENFNGLVVTNRYDSLLRRTNLQFQIAGASQFDHGYAYDAASRLASVALATNLITYAYDPNSDLVASITFKQNATTRMTTTKSYDFLNRLAEISSATGGVAMARFAYAYNAANQRGAVTNVDNSFWIYSYDNLGQVTSGKRYWSDGTPVAGQQYEYAFDDIGNRRSAKSGGDATGGGLRTENYTVNNVNQYTQRTVPGGLDILGAAVTNATVTVNGTPASRKGEYYRQGVECRQLVRTPASIRHEHGLHCRRWDE